MTAENSELSCDLTVLDNSQRIKQRILYKEVMSKDPKVREIVNGYMVKFAFDPSLLVKISELISLEHLCCPFFKFVLELDDSSIQLSITGPLQVKSLLRSLLKDLA